MFEFNENNFRKIKMEMGKNGVSLIVLYKIKELDVISGVFMRIRINDFFWRGFVYWVW